MATAEQTLIEGKQVSIERKQLYIGGEWVDPSGDKTIDVVNATTEEVMGHIPEGGAEDVDRAVKAARAAFDAWSQVPAVDRAELCAAVAVRLQDRAEEIATLISQEMGMPLSLSVAIQAGLPAMTFGSQPDLVQQVTWEEKIGNSL